MKKNLLLIALLLTANFFAKGQWVNQNVPYGFEGYLNDVEATDANTVWGNPWDALATTPYTQIFVRSVDGGNTWDVGTIGAPSTYSISNIWPINADTCFVCMWNNPSGGRIYKTTDGGTSWNQVGANMFQAATSFADVVYFWDGQNGMAMGDPVGVPLKYEVFKTSDAGATWTQVPPVNLPGLTNSAEYGITNLFSAVQGHIWFGTTYGDLYTSADMGTTWAKQASGLPAYTVTGGGRQDITDISFCDSLHGLVLQTTTAAYTIRQTSDGGATWTTIVPTGSFYAGDIENVPGTGIFVSSGSSTVAGFGTSYSLDYGLTWIELDNAVSHTAMDFVNINTGWTGEYILAGDPGGAWKLNLSLTPVACGDTIIASGTASVNVVDVCFGDTLVAIVSGAIAPNQGTGYFGFSWLISTSDISGNSDPLNDVSFVGGSGISGSGQTLALINTGVPFVAGTYYFTPVVYGNATALNPPTYVFDLTLDPLCTYTGNSIMVVLHASGDTLCTPTGINELNHTSLSVSAFLQNANTIQVKINAANNDKAVIKVFDLTGRMVFTNSVTVSKGENNELINASMLGAGTYFISVETSSAKSVTKLIKL